MVEIYIYSKFHCGILQAYTGFGLKMDDFFMHFDMTYGDICLK